TSHGGRMALLAYDLHPDGTAAFRQVLVDYAPQAGPDGLVCDAEGNLYAANFRAAKVLRVNSAGQIDLEIRVEGPMVTNCCFGGPDFDQLYITEGTLGRVYRADLGIKGLALFGP
ncbi:MAG: SMP-30/gluconolactonase/LRE family protein, partial [Chloroflexota bacterium]|nr:SMP-30/gluconolactonase/LRE family protein [Chloroflexota bacterium]